MQITIASFMVGVAAIVVTTTIIIMVISLIRSRFESSKTARPSVPRPTPFDRGGLQGTSTARQVSGGRVAQRRAANPHDTSVSDVVADPLVIERLSNTFDDVSLILTREYDTPSHTPYCTPTDHSSHDGRCTPSDPHPCGGHTDHSSHHSHVDHSSHDHGSYDSGGSSDCGSYD